MNPLVVASITGGGTRFDTAPLGPGPNWVTHSDPVTGIGLYVRAIAHALMRNGHDESSAIAIALGAVKRWAAGGGHVHPEVRARAAEAVKHWEELKLIAHAHSLAALHRAGDDSAERAAGDGTRDWQKWNAEHQPFVWERAAQDLDAARKVKPTWNPTEVASGLGLEGTEARSFAAGYDAARRMAVVHGDDAEAATHQMADNFSMAKAHDGGRDLGLQLTYAGMAMGYKHHADAQSGERGFGKAARPQNCKYGSHPATESLLWAEGAAYVPVCADHKAAAIHKIGGPGEVNRVISIEGTRNWERWNAEHAATDDEVRRGRPTTAEHLSRLATQDRLTFTGEGAPAPATIKAGAAGRKVSVYQDDPDAWSAEVYAHHPDDENDTTLIGHLHFPQRGARDAAEWGAAGPPSMDPSGAANLLPIGLSKEQAEDIDAAISPHRFKGTDLHACAECGRAVTDPVHRRSRRSDSPVAGTRHAGPGHVPVTTGHIKGVARRRHQASKTLLTRDADSMEGPLTDSLKRYFAEQRKSTVNRLAGKRGRQMFHRAGYRADQPPPGGSPEQGEPPAIPGDVGAVTPAPGAAAMGLDPTAIFDQDFWDEKLAGMLQPYYEQAAASSSARLRSTLELPSEFDDSSSLGAARAYLANRGNMTSPKINETTYQQIVDQLQDGVTKGEGLSALTKRVNDVFDQADRVRAQRIAQTESMAALNGSAHAYATALPEGTIGSQTWMAHHDERTRFEHRLADGQTVPVGTPFYVGGVPMMYPGDPAAPPHLVINCRCGVGYLPPGMDAGKLAFVAKQLHAQTAQKLGVALAPEAAAYIAS